MRVYLMGSLWEKFAQHWQLDIAHEGIVKGGYQWDNDIILKEADCLHAVSSCLLKKVYYKSNHKTWILILIMPHI